MRLLGGRNDGSAVNNTCCSTVDPGLFPILHGHYNHPELQSQLIQHLTSASTRHAHGAHTNRQTALYS